jgi:hypothetical protein
VFPALLPWTAATAQDGASAAGAERLAYFAGTWDVRVSFAVPGGATREGRAVCVASLILQGAFLQRDYASIFRGESLLIRQLIGYDDQRRAYVEFQLHAGGGAPTQTRRLEGTAPAGGAVPSLEGEVFDTFTGRPVRLRTVTRIVDPDRFTLEEWFRPEPNAAEELRVVLHHTRRR